MAEQSEEKEETHRGCGLCNLESLRSPLGRASGNVEGAGNQRPGIGAESPDAMTSCAGGEAPTFPTHAHSRYGQKHVAVWAETLRGVREFLLVFSNSGSLRNIELSLWYVAMRVISFFTYRSDILKILDYCPGLPVCVVIVDPNYVAGVRNKVTRGSGWPQRRRQNISF